ncbi:MAG: CheR family methyltransferase [Myxococcota bacterium]
MSLHFSPQLFAILSQLIEERLGLHYGAQDISLLGERVSSRAVVAGFDSLLDYYYYLRYDEGSAEEMDRLAEALVVHETYFFREFEQLQVAVEHFIKPRVHERGSAAVWSAACSTGEEPLTLAMLLEEQNLLSRTRIIASDLSEQALRQAKEGTRSARSLRQNPRPDLVSRWLERSGERWTVSRQLREAIEWRKINLMEAARALPPASIDVVLCRNVLIYFSDRGARAVIEQMEALLRPGGAIFVGVSESLMRLGTGLRCMEQHGVFYYMSDGSDSSCRR